MTDAAIIQATFSEWRMVKGRKVLQIICEVPLEAQGAVFGALGAPMPDRETWVAIARLRGEQKPVALPEAPRTGSLSQQAGILCGESAFQRWVAETTGVAEGPVEAAEFVRAKCQVKSRADFDKDFEAARRFRDLRADYDIWRKGLAA